MALIRFARRTPCAVLLVAQVVGILLYPFLDDSTAGRQLFALFGLLVLGLAVIAVRATPLLWWAAGLIAAPAVVLLVVQVATNDADLVPWSSGFESALYFYAAAAMLTYMLADDRVTTDELFAIGAVFTLLAWAFAHLYVVIQAVDPGAFAAATLPDVDRTWTELLFLSFTTLSSTGLSDVMPVSGHARSVVMLEQVAGLFYIAMVVTRLIGMQAARTTRAAARLAPQRPQKPQEPLEPPSRTNPPDEDKSS